MRLGLIGKTLQHSFSKKYFEDKFKAESLKGYSYELYELPNIEQFPILLKENPDLTGLNVTIPYKTQIIPYLDQLDESAYIVGAVNCISIKDGEIIGFNTDIAGFMESLKPYLRSKPEHALILGNGGAARAVAYCLHKLGVAITVASRSLDYSRYFQEKYDANVIEFKDLTVHDIRKCLWVVNCTPLGTFPDVEEAAAIPYEGFSASHLAYDLVYNPEKTQFMLNAESFGATTQNGMAMLIGQAERAWGIWG